MRSFDELERMWQERVGARREGAVRLITLRLGEGRHVCPELAMVSLEDGVVGDRWATGSKRDLECQVTLMDIRVAELVTGTFAPLDAPGDNFLVNLDLGEAALPAGTRVQVGQAVLEISEQPHTGCKFFRERMGADALRWINHESTRGRRLRGVNCRVVTGGEVAVGDLALVVV